MGIKGWTIRVALALALGCGAAFVVQALHLGLIVLIYGSLDEFLSHKHKREDFWLLDLGLSTMTAGMIATFIASFLSVLVAPAHYPDRLVLRSWAMAALLAALAGCGIGAMLSLLHPQHVSLNVLMILVMATGIMIGSTAAIFLRVRVNR